jgi:hypothetical protein
MRMTAAASLICHPCSDDLVWRIIRNNILTVSTEETMFAFVRFEFNREIWMVVGGWQDRGLRFQPDSTQSLSVWADDVKYGSKFECDCCRQKTRKEYYNSMICNLQGWLASEELTNVIDETYGWRRQWCHHFFEYFRWLNVYLNTTIHWWSMKKIQRLLIVVGLDVGRSFYTLHFSGISAACPLPPTTLSHTTITHSKHVLEHGLFWQTYVGICRHSTIQASVCSKVESGIHS